MPLVELYLDPYFIWDRLNADSSANYMYIIFATLHSLWSGNDVLCSLSVERVLMFIIRVLSCVMMAVASSIYLIASNMFW